MNCVYLLTIFLAFAAAEEVYSTENDDFDIDALVKNQEQLKEFLGCFMEAPAASCNEVAADFKKDIPDAVATSCSKCTPAQKHIFHTFLQALKEKMPSDYAAFKNKYDPEGQHFSALEAAIANS